MHCWRRDQEVLVVTLFVDVWRIVWFSVIVGFCVQCLVSVSQSAHVTHVKPGCREIVCCHMSSGRWAV
jgi:hypothetical protein